MRHGKNPTRQQKQVLIKHGLDAKQYLYICMADNDNKIVFQDRKTGAIKTLDKN